MLQTLPQVSKGASRSYWATGRKQLGPRNIYISKYGEKDGAVLAGTATAATSATITGTSTTFLADLKPGDFVKFGTLANTFRVKSVASDTSFDIYTPITVTADTITRISLQFLGKTDATKINFGLTKTDLKSSQEGDVRADKAVTGYNCAIEAGLAEPTHDDVVAVTQGMHQQIANDGSLKSMYFSFPLGELDSDNLYTVYLVRLLGSGLESTDPNDTLVILKAAPSVETEFNGDAATQIFYKTMFEGYIDENTVINGRPLIFYVGDIS